MKDVTFAVGDRVILSEPNGWVQPYRDMGLQGRPATIIRMRAGIWAYMLISFDTLRKGARPREMWVRERDIAPTSDHQPIKE